MQAVFDKASTVRRELRSIALLHGADASGNAPRQLLAALSALLRSLLQAPSRWAGALQTASRDRFDKLSIMLRPWLLHWAAMLRASSQSLLDKLSVTWSLPRSALMAFSRWARAVWSLPYRMVCEVRAAWEKLISLPETLAAKLRSMLRTLFTRLCQATIGVLGLLVAYRLLRAYLDGRPPVEGRPVGSPPDSPSGSGGRALHSVPPTTSTTTTCAASAATLSGASTTQGESRPSPPTASLCHD